MEKSIAANTYIVKPQATFKSTFAGQKLSLVSVGSVLTPGRKSGLLKDKIAESHFVATILKADNGEQIMVDGLQIAQQALTDKALKDEVFAKLKGSYVGDKLVITECEFKATFTIACAGNKFSC